jgi:hypothetical protein
LAPPAFHWYARRLEIIGDDADPVVRSENHPRGGDARTTGLASDLSMQPLDNKLGIQRQRSTAP